MNTHEFCTWLSGVFVDKNPGEGSLLGKIKAKLTTVNGFNPNVQVSTDEEESEEEELAAARKAPIRRLTEIVTRKK